MKNYLAKEKRVSELDSLTCDVCGKTYSVDKLPDCEESQEFLHIKLQGGYRSIFGDGSTIECDICQYCLKKTLGAYLRIEDE